MAYIPPHKRLLQSSTTPTISPALDSSALHHPPQFVPLGIPWSPHSVRRFFVLTHPLPPLLQFQPFDGYIFRHSHLEGSPLYTLKAASSPDQDTDPSSVSHTPSLAFDESAEFREEVFHSIVETLRDDLISVIASLKTRVDNLVPEIYLHFGRILFSPMDRVWFDWKRDYTPEFLESQFKVGLKKDIRKTFYNRMTFDAMPPLWERAKRDTSQIRTKHLYFIQVADKLRPDTNLLCSCTISSHDAPKSDGIEDAETSQENSDGLQQLRIRKVRWASPLRHMVADIACIGKSHDLRLMLCAKEYLSEEDRSHLETWLRHAVVHEDVEGGRFELLPSFHSKSYSFREGGVKWRLHKPSHGNGMLEVSPMILKEFLKGHKECSLDDITVSLNKLLEVAWKCLSGNV